MSQGIELAVVGAAGIDGDNLLQLIGPSGVPLSKLHALDSNARLGRYVESGDKRLPLGDYHDFPFEQCDLALVCPGVPAEVIERIRAQGCTLLAPAALLADADLGPVLADVNGERLVVQKGDAIAVPDAAAAVLATLLSPLQDEEGVVAAQAVWLRPVSADGRQAMEGLAAETAQLLNGQSIKPRSYGEKIAFNLLARDSNAAEAGFLQLWQTLWGDEIDFSQSEAVAPLFFGELLQLRFECESPVSLERVRAILGTLSAVEWVDGKDGYSVSAATAVGNERLRIGALRAAGANGRAFSCWLSVDAARVGLAENLLKITNLLAKKLFVSYS